LLMSVSEREVQKEKKVNVRKDNGGREEDNSTTVQNSVFGH
jgi:hypothetical protein